METIILLGFLEGLIIALLILLKHRKTVSDYLLSAFFLIYAINTLLSYLEIYNRTHGFPYPAFIFVSSPVLLLHGPAIWIYVKSLTDQHFKIKPIYLLHLIPFMLCVLDFTLRYYTSPIADKITELQTEAFKKRPDYPIMIVMMASSALVYFSWSAILVKRYSRRIKSYFSEIKNYDLTWLQLAMIASAIVYTVIYVAFIADLIFPVASFRWMHEASFVLGSVYLIFLGFFGHKQGNLFSDKPISIELKEEAPLQFEKEIEEKNSNDFVFSLLEYMKEKKPYLNTEITLSSLSSEMGISPDYLSKTINQQLGKNFFDFINHYRIEEFKIRCQQPENRNFTLIAIAYDCGFNSKATFNRVFKNATGYTPGDYARKSH